MQDADHKVGMFKVIMEGLSNSGATITLSLATSRSFFPPNIITINLASVGGRLGRDVNFPLACIFKISDN